MFGSERVGKAKDTTCRLSVCKERRINRILLFKPIYTQRKIFVHEITSLEVNQIIRKLSEINKVKNVKK